MKTPARIELLEEINELTKQLLELEQARSEGLIANEKAFYKEMDDYKERAKDLMEKYILT